MKIGYLTYNEIDCVYVMDNMNMFITPVKKDDISKLYRLVECTDFLLGFSDEIYKKSVAFIKNAYPRMDNSIHCNAIFISKLIDENIDSLEITGDDVDQFFSPTSYFFQLHKGKKLVPKELMYNKETVRTYNFNYEGKPITVNLNYGNILKNGRASDLKLHARIFVTFPETSDICLVYQIYLVFIRFLHFVKHQQQHNLLPIELNKMNSNVGFLYDDLYVSGKFNQVSNIESLYFDNYISNLLQLFADDQDYPKDFFPNNSDYSFEYTTQRFLSVFGAFERECKLNPTVYDKSDDSKVDSLKSEILSKINECEKKTVEENEFARQAKGRVSQLWTQSGQKRKIENAYNVLSEALSSSIENILWRIMREHSEASVTQLMSIVASTLTDLRGKVAHGELNTNFTDNEVQCINFLEVLTYAQTLKRAKIPDEDIELMVGAIFNCNYKFMTFYEQQFKAISEQ